MSGAPTIEETKQTVRDFFGAVTAGEFERAAELVVPTGGWATPRRHATVSLADQVRLLSTEGMAFTIEQLTAEEDRVSALASGYTTAGDGTRVSKTFHFLIRLEAERIADVVMYDDGSLADRLKNHVAKDGGGRKTHNG
ncbi:nuclear transport factor 2 family protein [Pseudonocardia sp. CA-107938]|uniref:nuclear transport factor 2 family protein n=1 Tax=Pseudonocardia sp. CA-107938 TaxID=3240021 RepID=UPI003D8EE9B2